MPPADLLRLLTLFLAGVAVGGFLNAAIYRLAWFPRPISPWAWWPTAGTEPPRWIDRLPLAGWLTWRHRATGLGPAFWFRPLLVEILTGALFAGLYWWEVIERGLLPEATTTLTLAGPVGLATMLQAQCAAHLLLVSLMIVATFIDLDEKTIPDSVTLPGTLIGLTIAALWPWALLPIVKGRGILDFLRLTSPNPWPLSLDGAPETGSLLIGLACFWGWCLALLPWIWRGRRGWRVAVRLVIARLAREVSVRWIAGLAVVGSVSIAAVWSIGGPRWEGLLTALVGAAGGGAIVWIVRIVGTTVLGREAMGFGDVTLMAMLGTFLGWQTCLLIFFMAPFAALVVGVAQWFIRRDKEIPYGPFLCLAALGAIVYWAPLWNWARLIFALGWMIPAAFFVCMGVMAVLLAGWKLVSGSHETEP